LRNWTTPRHKPPKKDMVPKASNIDRILVVGTGALATLFGARLAGAGYQVVILGHWADGLRALREGGTRVITAAGEEQRFPVTVIDDPQDCPGINYALVLVKSWQTPAAAIDLKACMSSEGLAVTLQNGLGNVEALAASLGKQRVALGSTTTGATLLGPGLVKPGGEGKVVIGRHPRLDPLKRALRAAGFSTTVVDDARALVWEKLVINSAINPLTALLRVPNGRLLERPAARALLHRLARETAAVAAAEKVHLKSRDPVKAVEDVARRTAANHSSMFQDVQRGAPTEIDAICGAVARLGKGHRIPTPVNDTCWHLVSALTTSSPKAKAAG
jgi:2-dehydropantoate 2-reductase